MKRIGSQSYSTCRGDFNSRRSAVSPLKIQLTGFYNSSARTGTANIHITNTINNQIAGTLQCIVTETNIAYAWQTQDSLFDLVRDMIPDQNGEAVSIPAGGSIDKSKNFTINAGWDASHCNIVVFVQNSAKEIYQAAKMSIMSVGAEETTLSNTSIKLSNSGNPFTSGTFINYSIDGKASRNIHMAIYDMSGKLVKKLVNDRYEPGAYKLYWNGQNSSGIKVPSGIYFCVLNSDGFETVNKLVLAR